MHYSASCSENDKNEKIKTVKFTEEHFDKKAPLMIT